MEVKLLEGVFWVSGTGTNIYIYIYIFMIFDKDQVDSARRIESELNISSII